MSENSCQNVCVDLDGTLVRTDTLVESFLQLLKYKFHYIFLLPLWLLKGKAFFKFKISQYAKLTPGLLPYNQAVIEYIKEKKANGCKLYLVTASQQSTADKVARHLDIFDGQFGSSDSLNIKGTAKAQLLNSKFGEKQYEYIGDSKADLNVWRHSGYAVVVDNPGLAEKTRKYNIPTSEIISSEKSGLIAYLKMIRLHQWVKNFLIFIPLLLSHSILDVDKFTTTFFGFLLFSLAASGIYVFNDLVDINNDRTHPRKSKRPLASGLIPISHGLVIGCLLWGLSLGISLYAYPYLFLLILFYISLNFVYSTILKRIVLIDVIVLAGFYIIRLLVGGIMTGESLSFWLITFSLFIFFSLALAKRYIELAHHMDGKSDIRGRGYSKEDEHITSILGIASGLVSCLVMALYIHDPYTKQLYQNSSWLWMTIPALLYWISRIWLKAFRDEIGDDPISFAIKDIESYLVASVLMLSIYISL